MLRCWRKGKKARWSKNNDRRKKKEQGGAAEKPVESGGRAGVLKRLLKIVEKKLTEKEVKATLGDYIKLVQLQKEMDDEQPREIRVTWVEPEETKSGSEE
jgi:hypothetical protein